MLIDPWGRRVSNLRISLTDLCNFRCVYCVPPEGLLTIVPPAQYLTRPEIVRFVRLMGKLGVTRVRLTGGEPLLRKDILEIVRALKGIETVKDLSLTTNGSFLAPLVYPLKEAGLDRINVSLDSLDPKRFEEITLSDTYGQVIKAVFLALQAGFPVKLNMVVLRGLTAKEIVEYVQMACDFPLEVRFLEFMPLCGTAWKPELVWPIEKVRSVVKEHFDLMEDEIPRLDSPAQTFKIKGGKGRVGFIASLTESFCDNCSRIRLSADGKISPCLFSDTQVSVRNLLRENAPDEEILRAIQLAVKLKPRGNWFRDHPFKFEEDKDLEFLANPMIRSIGG
ncbi:MAG: GTP 3',8-cyclase MoaA [Candidatus Omnitrophota bacterium]